MENGRSGYRRDRLFAGVERLSPDQQGSRRMMRGANTWNALFENVGRRARTNPVPCRRGPQIPQEAGRVPPMHWFLEPWDVPAGNRGIKREKVEQSGFPRELSVAGKPRGGHLEKISDDRNAGLCAIGGRGAGARRPNSMWFVMPPARNALSSIPSRQRPPRPSSTTASSRRRKPRPKPGMKTDEVCTTN